VLSQQLGCDIWYNKVMSIKDIFNLIAVNNDIKDLLWVRFGYIKDGLQYEESYDYVTEEYIEEWHPVDILPIRMPLNYGE